MQLSELDKWLATLGWIFDRQRSSHRHYRNGNGKMLTVVVHKQKRTKFALWQIHRIEREIERIESSVI